MSSSRFGPSCGAAVAVVAGLAGLALLLAPAEARAFCGFYVAGGDAKLSNNASQVVLMRKGNRTVMTMSNTYQGPPADFAMVVPVPVVLQEGGREDAARRRVRSRRLAVGAAPGRVLGAGSLPAACGPMMTRRWRRPRRRRRPRRPARARATWASRSRRASPSANTRSSSCRPRTRPGSRPGCAGASTTSPRRGRAALAPVRARQVEVLRRQGRHQEGEARRRRAWSSCRRCASPSTPTSCACRCASACSTPAASRISSSTSSHPTARFEVANYPNVFIPTNLDVAMTCARASPRSTPSSSTPPSSSTGARRSSPSTRGRRRPAIRARSRRSSPRIWPTLGRRRARAVQPPPGQARSARHRAAACSR